jgi:hypothetical protein
MIDFIGIPLSAYLCHQQKILAVERFVDLVFGNDMEKLLEQINDRIAAFQKDAYLQWFKGNKAAGRRARKAALELMALLKEFRKASLEAGR